MRRYVSSVLGLCKGPRDVPAWQALCAGPPSEGRGMGCAREGRLQRGSAVGVPRVVGHVGFSEPTRDAMAVYCRVCAAVCVCVWLRLCG